ncbi:hypothetical protein [Oceanirhabdus sp. W0125-5]|uniref:hypothetical protein n=1 Tax=Oceanirhabdus sp. W0125-5 TaxID=2999116 RepID=UPI0022F2DD76|nr:hypothetical protein [Oceanirhabdus sp. W0125-5]WBW97571.1 hypothetical protein OW730_01845 [Oceanirhabdus sp. W0125-5]
MKKIIKNLDELQKLTVLNNAVQDVDLCGYTCGHTCSITSVKEEPSTDQLN